LLHVTVGADAGGAAAPQAQDVALQEVVAAVVGVAVAVAVAVVVAVVVVAGLRVAPHGCEELLLSSQMQVQGYRAQLLETPAFSAAFFHSSVGRHPPGNSKRDRQEFREGQKWQVALEACQIPK